MPKETSILFSAAMVLAILQLLKTITRRVITTLRGFGRITEFGKSDTPGYDWHFRDREMRWHDLTNDQLLAACPYGKVGDRLWVKEAWTPDHAAFYPCFPLVYRADFGQPYDRNERCEVYSSEQKAWYPFRWRPSLFMQRHNSRITLEIVSTRIERLNAIGEADAMAEGLIEWTDPPRVPTKHYGLTRADVWETSAVKAYARLWDSINAKPKPKHIRRRKSKDKPTEQFDAKHPPKPDNSWAANPFVWVIEFKRVQREVAA